MSGGGWRSTPHRWLKGVVDHIVDLAASETEYRRLLIQIVMKASSWEQQILPDRQVLGNSSCVEKYGG